MNEKVLLVDDEPMVLEAIRRQLARKFTVLAAPSGPAGLELVERAGTFAAASAYVVQPFRVILV